MVTAAQLVAEVKVNGAAQAEAELAGTSLSADAVRARFAALKVASMSTSTSFAGMSSASSSMSGAMNQAGSAMAGAGVQAEKAGMRFSSMGLMVALAGAAIVAAVVGIGLKSAEMAANFQTAVNRLRTGAGDTTDSFAKLSAGILKVSTDTGVMSGPLTTAMYEILSSGQRGAKAFDTLSVAAKGAVIEQANVKDVADTLSGTMTNFGTKVFGASQYMNGLITAVAHGRITLQDLSTSMGPIEPVAHAMGISFSDLAAAMSTQTNAAIPAARAATGLRFMMQSLEVPTLKAKTAMKDMGLDSVKVAQEMKVSLPGALQMVYNAAKKAGPEGSVPFNRAVSDMVGGQRSLATFLALTGTHMKAFKGNAEAIAGSMQKGKGDVQGWALAQGNFNVQMDKAKAAVEAAGIKIGLALLPALGKLLGFIPPLVDYLSHFSEHANVLIPVLAGVGAVLLALVVPAVWALAAGILAATWPALAIGVAVAALVAIFMHFYQTNAGFKAFIDKLVAGFKVLMAIVGTMVSSITNDEEKMRIAHEQKIVAMRITADNNLAKMAQQSIQHLEVQRQGILKKLDETHDPAKRKELEFQLHMTDIQIQHQRNRMALAEADKKKQLAKQKELHDQMLEAQKWFGQRFLDMMGQMLGHVFSVIGSWARDTLTRFKNFFGDTFSNLGSFIRNFLDSIGRWKDGVIAKVAQMVTDFVNWIKSLPGRIAALAGDLFQAGMGIVRNIASGIISGIGSFLGNAMSQIGSFISSHLPHSPAKIGPLRDLEKQGSQIVEQISRGMRGSLPQLSASLRVGLAPLTSTGSLTGLATPARFAGGVGQPVINVYVQAPDMNLDGVRVSRQLMPHFASALRYNAIGGVAR